MRLTHFKQQADHTCGPAAMRIALHSLSIRKTEPAVAKLLKTTTNSGTKNAAFARAARKLKLNYATKETCTYTEIKKLLKKRYRIIVCYFYAPEKVFHYAVVRSIGRKYIHLCDPWCGPFYKMLLPRFRKLWRNDQADGGGKRWCFGVKKR